MLQQTPREMSALTGEHVGTYLDRLDVLLGKLGMGLKPDEALEIPALLDQVYSHVEQADPESQGGKAAAAQFEAFSQAYKKQLAVFLREVGDPTKLEAARAAANPPADHWWWRPEEVLGGERKSSLKKTLVNVAIGAGILAVLVIVYQLFLRPSPEVIAVLNAQREAEELMVRSGDTAAALARIDEGLAQVPGDSELLVLRGCYLTLIGGRQDEAEAAFNEAQKKVGSREYVLLMSAQDYSILGRPALAQSNAEAAIAINPKLAQGYLILGQALEDQGDRIGAYDAYEKASTLGMENDDPTVTAQARMKLGMLMQSINMLPEQPQPTPSVTP
jgi:tetratricopeptide (TPR) repeat protein